MMYTIQNVNKLKIQRNLIILRIYNVNGLIDINRKIRRIRLMSEESVIPFVVGGGLA